MPYTRNHVILAPKVPEVTMLQFPNLISSWLGQIRVKWILLGSLSVLVSVILVMFLPKHQQPEIWYVKNFDKVRALNPVTHQQRVLPLGQLHEFASDPGFSPDGRWLAFKKAREDEEGQIIDAIWMAEVSAFTPFKITIDFYGGVDYFWLDHYHLAIIGINDRWQRPDQGDWFLYHIPTQQLRQVQPPGNLAITCRQNRASIYANRLPIISSPPTLPPTFWELQDGVIRLVGGDTDVVALGHLEVKGDALQLVTNVPIPPGDVGCDSWTPDGERAAISRRTAYHAYDIFLVTDQGRQRRPLTEFWRTYEGGASIGTLSISPDGRWIIFQAHLYQPRFSELVAGNNLLMLLNADDGRLEFLGEHKLYGNFVWSPNSRQVAASLSPRGADPDKGGEVHLIDVATRQVTQLTFDGGFKEVFDWR